MSDYSMSIVFEKFMERVGAQFGEQRGGQSDVLSLDNTILFIENIFLFLTLLLLLLLGNITVAVQ